MNNKYLGNLLQHFRRVGHMMHTRCLGRNNNTQKEVTTKHDS